MFQTWTSRIAWSVSILLWFAIMGVVAYDIFFKVY